MPPKKSSNAPMIVAITVAVVVVLALMAFFAYLFFFRQDEDTASIVPTIPSTVAATEEETTPSTQAITENPAAALIEVPDLTGLSETDTYKTLNRIGANYTVAREFSDTVASGHVITQNPEPGSEISKSDTVTVYLSKGREDELVTEATTKPDSKQSSQGSKPSSSLQSSATTSTGGYILPYSNIRKLSKDELKQLSRSELNLALNEIYARRGRIFKDASLSAYFNSQSWYNGTIPADRFDSVVTFNEYESYNINLISNYQSELGYR